MATAMQGNKGAAGAAGSTGSSLTPVVKWPEIVWPGAAARSIIPPDVEHVIFVTGFRGNGKTSFCLGIDNPANILMLDYESKGGGLAKPLGVGGYFPILDECTEAMGKVSSRAVYQRTKQILEAAPPGRFTTLVLDNAGLLQEGCLEEVKTNPLAWGIDPGRAASGQYGGAWPGVGKILKGLTSIARTKGIKVVAVTFQLTAAWGQGGPLLNKFKTSGVAFWQEASILTLVMVPGLARFMPIPSALVMKEQLGQLEWDEAKGETKVRRRLPFKLPKATMAEVYRYLREPVDFAALKEGEMPEPGEIEPYLPTFSKEQLRQMMELAKAAEVLRIMEQGEVAKETVDDASGEG